jgi:hypothetical protein
VGKKLSDTPTPARLKRTRRHLFDQGRAAATPADLVAWQRELLEALLESEQWPLSDLHRRHTSRCHLMADEMVWRHLHPHAIKIQSWWTRTRPGLSSQLPAIRLTFDVAEILADHGIPPIVTDLSSCLTSGDVLGVIDRERPAIIECKARSIGGRRDSRSNRQVRRYRRQAQHLRQGGTHDTETGVDHVIVEPGPVGNTLEGLIGSCSIAMKLGRGLVLLPPAEAYLALMRSKRGSPDTFFETIAQAIPNPSYPLIANTFDMNDAPDPRWPPPSFRLSDAGTAWAVLENDMMVVRFADVGELLEAAGESARLEGDRIVVDSEGEHMTWENAIGMVMNGFDSVAGTAAMMRSQIRQIHADLDTGEIDRRRASWAEDPVDVVELTLDDLRSTKDLPALLSAPLVVFQS